MKSQKVNQDIAEAASNIIACYSGYHKDNNILLSSSSGGLATALSETIIELGGVVVGVTYSKGYKSAEYILIDSIDDIKKIQGTKYIFPVIKKELLDKIANYLSSPNPNLLFIGLPCHITALKKFLLTHNIDDSHLYTVDLICHGPTSSKVAQQYITYIEKRKKSKVVNFSVRYKLEGWKPLYLRAVFKNGKETLKLWGNTLYGYAFKNMPNQSCYNCKHKGINHKSDITIGDFWGVEKYNKNWNKNGVSVAFVKTLRGQSLLKLLNNFILNEENTYNALIGNPMYYKSVKKTKKQEDFYREFKNHGLFKAFWKTSSLKEKISSILPTSYYYLRYKIKKD